MTIACPAPDETLGTVLRLSAFIDCQARALGENGFDALAGGAMISSALTAAVTIFVAIIGYRLVLGRQPTLAGGVGLAIRLGMALTLATSWPAVRTLVYDVALIGPMEITSVLARSVGLPADETNARLQRAYDVVVHGTYISSGEDTAPPAPSGGSQGAAPTTVGVPNSPWGASLIILSGIGVPAALALIAGFLVALAPLAAIALLFDATLGIFAGWIAALAGAALGMAATGMVAAVEVAIVESEIARAMAAQAGRIDGGDIDPQAFTTIGVVFSLIAVVAAVLSIRAIGLVRVPAANALHTALGQSNERSAVPGAAGLPVRSASMTGVPMRSRATMVADAVSSDTRRGRDGNDASSSGASLIGNRRATGGRVDLDEIRQRRPLGPEARRTTVRGSRSASRRDAVR